MFVPGFVENWTVIMEASNLSFSSLSNIDVFIVWKLLKILSIRLGHKENHKYYGY